MHYSFEWHSGQSRLLERLFNEPEVLLQRRSANLLISAGLCNVSDLQPIIPMPGLLRTSCSLPCSRNTNRPSCSSPPLHFPHRIRRKGLSVCNCFKKLMWNLIIIDQMTGRQSKNQYISKTNFLTVYPPLKTQCLARFFCVLFCFKLSSWLTHNNPSKYHYICIYFNAWNDIYLLLVVGGL